MLLIRFCRQNIRYSLSPIQIPCCYHPDYSKGNWRCYLKYHDIKREPMGVPSIKAECLTKVMAHCSTSVAELSWFHFFFAFNLLNPVIPVCFANRVPSPAKLWNKMLSKFTPAVHTSVSTCQYKWGLLWFGDSSSLISQHSLLIPALSLLLDFLKNFLPFFSVSVSLMPSFSFSFWMFYQNLATSLNTGQKWKAPKLRIRKTYAVPTTPPSPLPSLSQK